MAAFNGSQIQGSETFEHQDAHGYTWLSEHGDLPRAHVEVPGGDPASKRGLRLTREYGDLEYWAIPCRKSS